MCASRVGGGVSQARVRDETRRSRERRAIDRIAAPMHGVRAMRHEQHLEGRERLRREPRIAREVDGEHEMRLVAIEAGRTRTGHSTERRILVDSSRARKR